MSRSPPCDSFSFLCLRIIVNPFYLDVVLVGGSQFGSGNLLARNPVTGISGVVSDSSFDINDVII